MFTVKTGFTLVEILTAIIIVTILVAVVTPMYEKTIERSRLMEARTILQQLQEAKLLSMTKMGLKQFGSGSSPAGSNCLPGMEHLNVAYGASSAGYCFSTKYFTYSLIPSGSGTNSNGVCATDGEAVLYYYRPFGSKTETGESVFSCYGDKCEDIYGIASTSSAITCGCSCTGD